MSKLKPRAAIFVDGSNWYHSLRGARVSDLGQLDYRKIFDKLCCRDFQWTRAGYYTADVAPLDDDALRRDQREFLDRVLADDSRIEVVLGRLEQRLVRDETAAQPLRYLARLPVRIDQEVYSELVRFGRSRVALRTFVEKAVDVRIAVDMVSLAAAGQFEMALLLSADGDFTPAVEAVRRTGREVWVATAAPSHRLSAAANRRVRLTREWFADCRRERG